MPQTASAAAAVRSPTVRQLTVHGINCALPMVGFGFMDNLVMIQAGDLIDNHIGVAFGLSTLTAAAFGQVFSDLSGVCFGGAVEQAAARLGLPRAKMSAEQLDSRGMRIFSTFSAAVGVVIGCLLGMVSLLFMDLEKAERAKNAKKLEPVFRSLVRDGRRVLKAQRVNLWVLSKDGKHMWSKAFTGEIPSSDRLRAVFDRYDVDNTGLITADNLIHAFQKLGWTANEQEILREFRRVRPAREAAAVAAAVSDADDDKGGSGKATRKRLRDLRAVLAGGKPRSEYVNTARVDFDQFERLIQRILGEERRIPLREGGAKHRVLRSGQTMNIPNAYSSLHVNNFGENGSTRKFDRYTGYDTFSMLLVPVTLEDGRVIGLVEFANKSIDGIGYQAFDKNDEMVAGLLASVAAGFIADTIE